MTLREQFEREKKPEIDTGAKGSVQYNVDYIEWLEKKVEERNKQLREAQNLMPLDSYLWSEIQETLKK